MGECKICGRRKSTFEQYDPHDCNPRITREQLAVFDAAMELYEEYKANNLHISVGDYGFPKKFIDACRKAEEAERREA